MRLPYDKFGLFLKTLGYNEKDRSANLVEIQTNQGKTINFPYTINIQSSDSTEIPSNHVTINYVYTPTTDWITEIHSDYWNRNNVSVFIAVSDEKCHIINAREKPNQDDPLNNTINIKTFNYGINSTGYSKETINEISKDALDSTCFFDFVIKHQKSVHEVDKDLLLNLIALQNHMLTKGERRVVHLLILRCLFIKYLEDRGIYTKDYLLNILKSQSPEAIIKAFNEVQKINGDIFKDEPITPQEILPDYLQELARFFSSDYRSDQRYLFPYRFDKIPVQLISNVYEAFLKTEDKKEKGIFYTPAFIVQFMLAQTVAGKWQENPNATLLDPACGSGAFLVESFKQMVAALPVTPDYETKKEILESRLFGIDIDAHALQIAAFSLYLALLETEEPEFIRQQIEHAHPILPSLIGKTLICGNALTDHLIFHGKTFDYIISNPPWGSVPDDQNHENQKERSQIDNNSEYHCISNYERSQAFLLRVRQWGDALTIFSLIVKNSIFLNVNALEFRKELLEKYRLKYFYELSDLNRDLFKKQSIGKVDEKEILIGSSEPCAVVIMDQAEITDHITTYISPRLTGFSETFQMIHYTQKDIKQIGQKDFLEYDSLWKILVNGSPDDFQLIRKCLSIQPKITIECRSGIKPKSNMKSIGESDVKPLVEPEDFQRYVIIREFKSFNKNQTLERKRDERIFIGNRILIPVRPLIAHHMRLKGIRLFKYVIHKDNIVSIKLRIGKEYIDNYAPYLAIINSKLLGYYSFHISPQWGKGEEKRGKLRNIDIESLPLPVLDHIDSRTEKLTSLVEQLEQTPQNTPLAASLENEIDEIVFDLYGLLEFEKDMVREFFRVNVERKNKKDGLVRHEDMQVYVERFRRNFAFVLADGFKLNAADSISRHLGAVLELQIVPEADFQTESQKREIPILNIVKHQQMQESFLSLLLNEDKVKIYEENAFYLIKSTYFKDWTLVQATDDANEEIGLLLKNLPD